MSPRRDAGRARGKPIERAILSATLAEIAAHGPEAVSVARIAAAAEVNKTTIYRRWPTVGALVSAAIEHSLNAFEAQLVDTGSLDGDLRHMLGALATRLTRPAGRALMLAAMSEGGAAALVGQSLPGLGDLPGMVTRAVERGEWDLARGDPHAVIALLVGAVMHRVLLERRPADERWIASVVGALLGGISPD